MTTAAVTRRVARIDDDSPLPTVGHVLSVSEDGERVTVRWAVWDGDTLRPHTSVMFADELCPLR